MTLSQIAAAKSSTPLTMITAYDALFARLMAPVADMILVGDSLNMSFAGKPDTLSATLEQMIYHTQAVCSGAPKSFIICDMPFGTYVNEQQALENAITVFQQTDASAVKIEGGANKAAIVKHLCDNGIAVCGHIGLLPQSVRAVGGYKYVGRTPEDVDALVNDAKAIEAAGAFCIVLEGCVSSAAKTVAQSVKVPIIGIGAGSDVDGQVLVFSDMLGLFEPFTPKFVKKYLDGASLVKEAFSAYATEVQQRSFPSEAYEYTK